MTTESRRFANVTSTINGLFAYLLKTSSPYGGSAAANLSEADKVDPCLIGIRVWKRNAGGSETEITSGFPVAQTSFVNGGGAQSGFNTWLCALTSLNPTDNIVVRVYGMIDPTQGWLLLQPTSGTVGGAIFITEQLNASSLDAATWTVVYYVNCTQYGAIATLTWYFGGTILSRIDGFTWTPYVPSVVKCYGDGLTWIVALKKFPFSKRFPRFMPLRQYSLPLVVT
jgi:hypothetical protein